MRRVQLAQNFLQWEHRPKGAGHQEPALEGTLPNTEAAQAYLGFTAPFQTSLSLQ